MIPSKRRSPGHHTEASCTITPSKKGAAMPSDSTPPAATAATTPPFVFSIRAEYARRIIDGSKRWEFRTRLPHVNMGDLALIYEARGRGHIVATFRVGSIFHGMGPDAIWDTVERVDPGSHGIPRVDYDAYFKRRDSSVAFELTRVVPMTVALPLTMRPPQSWARWHGAWPPIGGATS